MPRVNNERFIRHHRVTLAVLMVIVVQNVTVMLIVQEAGQLVSMACVKIHVMALVALELIAICVA